ncbi:DUF3606 domain-containing protein [Variovorax sp. M-6]|uniref:DUF3606 domain-containing protein n=1 Tax=Variovorax sp. M-6 TaxID=3233041 RepID=UPI003F97F659
MNSTTGEDRVDLSSPESVARWTRELDVTRDQLEAAVRAVGDLAADVEMHLKGSRVSTNADKTLSGNQERND